MVETMKHMIEHDLDPATAKKVTDRAFAEYANRYPDYKPTLTWSDDRHADLSMSAKGVSLSGVMAIEEKAISLDLDVPFLFRPFKSKAIEVIDREVKVWIEKARSGQI
jgi:Putative polyhydroxyalkanoic acid system protein (PHA_gran_rgn)